MTTYRYIARDQQGQDCAGSIDATDAEQARLMLRDRGLDVREVTPTEIASAVPPTGALSASESTELVESVARLSNSNVPLAPGLRAAADESDNRRVRNALLWMATQVEQGQSLEEVVRKAGDLLPPYVAGLMLAALRSGTLGDALLALVEHQRVMRSLTRDIASSLAYPLTVLALSCVVVSYIVIHLTRFIAEFSSGFGLELPAATRLLLALGHAAVWILPGVLGSVAILALTYRAIGGRAAWQRLFTSLPLVGVFVHWAGIADWAGLMHVLLSNGLTLPESLRLAGAGMRNANVGRISERLADGVAHGRCMSELLSTTGQFPASIVPLIQWGEQGNAVAESMRIGRQAMERRVLIRAQLLQAVISPLLFIFLGCVILFVVAASFAPLIHLIRMLS